MPIGVHVFNKIYCVLDIVVYGRNVKETGEHKVGPPGGCVLRRREMKITHQVKQSSRECCVACRPLKQGQGLFYGSQAGKS